MTKQGHEQLKRELLAMLERYGLGFAILTYRDGSGVGMIGLGDGSAGNAAGGKFIGDVFEAALECAQPAVLEVMRHAEEATP